MPPSPAQEYRMNKLVARLCAFGLVLGLGLPARPAPAVPDIADFSLGITREETLLRAAVPCGDNLCGQVAFGGKTWGGTFRLRNDKLDAISLFGPPEGAYVEAAFEGFAESPYVVYRAVSDDAVFDFPALAAEGLSPEALDAAFVEFLRGLRSAGCTFASYFYTEPAVYAAMKQEAQKARELSDLQEASAEADSEKAKDDALSAKMPDAKSENAVSLSSTKQEEPEQPDVLPDAEDADSEHGEKTTERRVEPEPNPDGVVCNLTIDGEGIVIIIMSRADLQAEMAARAAREASDAVPEGDEASVARSASVQKT